MMKIKTRTRQLCNAKWVGEVKMGWFGKWRAVDNAGGFRYALLPGDANYKYCYFSEEKDAEDGITQYLAGQGI